MLFRRTLASLPTYFSPLFNISLYLSNRIEWDPMQLLVGWGGWLGNISFSELG